MKWKMACIQMDIAFGKPDLNYQLAEQWLEKAVHANADIVILPELWTTGYDLTRLNEIGDEEAEKTIEFIRNLALKHQIHIIGGSIAKKHKRASLTRWSSSIRTGNSLNSTISFTCFG